MRKWAGIPSLFAWALIGKTFIGSGDLNVRASGKNNKHNMSRNCQKREKMENEIFFQLTTLWTLIVRTVKHYLYHFVINFHYLFVLWAFLQTMPQTFFDHLSAQIFIFTAPRIIKENLKKAGFFSPKLFTVVFAHASSISFLKGLFLILSLQVAI